MHDSAMELLQKEYFKVTGSKMEPQVCQPFRRYLQLLMEWNQKFNLTAILDEKEIVRRHFVDSISCLQSGIFDVDATVIDIGTGAGLPGIPLKIMRPDMHITLVETIGKKSKFLELVCRELGLKGIRVLSERAEVLGRDELYREQFDIVISRALAKLPVAVELCVPFIKPGGYYLVMLGEDGTEQIQTSGFALQELGTQLIRNIELHTIPGKTKHSLCLFQKMVPTSPRYPRKPGIPTKRPLLK
jgi:16S rRNA (guanine527-N7)-methyltransferase